MGAMGEAVYEPFPCCLPGPFRSEPWKSEESRSIGSVGGEITGEDKLWEERLEDESSELRAQGGEESAGPRNSPCITEVSI
jgi:hypothetical protein